MSSGFIVKASGLLKKTLIFKSNFPVPGREIYDRHFLPKERVIWQMNRMAMNNSLWTTNSQSLSNFEFSHFCRYLPIMFDSCRYSLLNPTKSVLVLSKSIFYANLQMGDFFRDSLLNLFFSSILPVRDLKFSDWIG